MAYDILAEFECTVNSLELSDGDTVQVGDQVLTLNLMKMIIPVQTPVAGIVRYTKAVDDYVKEGDVLARVE